MTGWTFLRIWVSRQPIARKGVPLLTVMPVIPGLALRSSQAICVPHEPHNNHACGIIGWNTENPAPCGSPTTAHRPTFSIVSGPK